MTVNYITSGNEDGIHQTAIRSKFSTSYFPAYHGLHSPGSPSSDLLPGRHPDNWCLRGEHLEQVLRRLEEHGLTLHRAKCSFLKDSVEYLGQVVDAHGVHTSPRKVQAVKDAPPPKNVHELRSTLGMINYYRKFIPNLSALPEAQYRLLREGVLYQWTNGCELAFGKVKACLIKAPVLAHYDPDQPLVLAADASAYTVQAYMCQK